MSIGCRQTIEGAEGELTKKLSVSDLIEYRNVSGDKKGGPSLDTSSQNEDGRVGRVQRPVRDISEVWLFGRADFPPC